MGRAPFARPDWLRPAPIGVLVPGANIVAAGLFGVRAARTTLVPTHPEATRVLVQTVVYRITRNPIYLGLLVILNAWAMQLWQPQSFAALPVFAAGIHRFQFIPEARTLLKKFSQRLGNDATGTRRWLYWRRGCAAIAAPGRDSSR